MGNTRMSNVRPSFLPVSLVLLGLWSCDRGDAVKVPDALPLVGAPSETADAQVHRDSADDSIAASADNAMNSQASTAAADTMSAQTASTGTQADTTAAGTSTTGSTATTDNAGSTTTTGGSSSTTTTTGTSTSTDTTTKPTQSIPDGNYSLVSQQSGRCLDVPSSSKDAGTQLQIWDCNDTAAQIFTVTFVKDKYFKLINMSSGLAVQVRDQVPATYSWIDQGPYTGRNGQLFSIDKKSDNLYVLHSMGTTFAVDVTQALTDKGTKIQVYPENNYSNENWTFVKK